MSRGEPLLADAYNHCLGMATTHYENFPVASRLLPRRLRRPVAAIYTFARTADDLADEGSDSAEQRLAGLAELDVKLRLTAAGQPPDEPMWVALADTMKGHDLQAEPFEELLAAFRQDCSKHRYADFGEVMSYCRLSANPVGHLMLSLLGVRGERARGYSDAVCSALQLINFLQDVRNDLLDRDRVYLPCDELQRFGVTEQHLAAGSDGPGVRRLMQFQAMRARRLLCAGSPLGTLLTGRAGLYMRTIVLGGERVLKAKLDPRARPLDRPVLKARDWGWMLGRAAWAGIAAGGSGAAARA